MGGSGGGSGAFRWGFSVGFRLEVMVVRIVVVGVKLSRWSLVFWRSS